MAKRGRCERRSRPGSIAQLARCPSDAFGGETTARVEVPDRNGATLVVEALQREEEGGVDYEVACRPATPDEDTPHQEPYHTTAGGRAKIAKIVPDLAAPPS